MTPASPLQIEWTFLRLPPWPDDLIQRVKRLYFEDAAKRWGYVVKGLPARTDGAALQLPDGRPFTAIQIHVSFEHFGPNIEEAVVASTVSIERLHPSEAQPWNFPFRATLNIDLNEEEELLEDRAAFFVIIVHEIGHVLGIGTCWEDEVPGRAPLLGTDPISGKEVYVGKYAREANARLRKLALDAPPPIPLDKDPGMKSFHWSEDALMYEIMSPVLNPHVVGRGNVISAVSVGALQDLGYVVDALAAEPLPAPSVASPMSARLRATPGR